MVIILFLTTTLVLYYAFKTNRSILKKGEPTKKTEISNSAEVITKKAANKNNGWPDDYIDYSGGMLGL